MARIVRTDDVLGGDPRIEGTRIGVLHVYELAIEGDHTPADVADQLGISLGDVYTALAYYHEQPDEMRAVRERHSDVEERLSRTALSPPEPVK